jgi:hypothetical protein
MMMGAHIDLFDRQGRGGWMLEDQVRYQEGRVWIQNL